MIYHPAGLEPSLFQHSSFLNRLNSPDPAGRAIHPEEQRWEALT